MFRVFVQLRTYKILSSLRVEFAYEIYNMNYVYIVFLYIILSLSESKTQTHLCIIT